MYREIFKLAQIPKKESWKLQKFRNLSSSGLPQNHGDEVPFEVIKSDKLIQAEAKAVRKLKRRARQPFSVPDYTPPMTFNVEGSFFKIFKTNVEFSPRGASQYLKEKAEKYIIKSQEFNPMRHDILGYDLACAHFLVYNGGKVRFKGIDKWVTLNEDKKTVDMPYKFDPRFVVEAVDASDVLLYYEGLSNFLGLPRVTWASFARSKFFDDWFLDKISTLFPFVDYLDISENPKLTERGLEALYRAVNLRTLVITNYRKTAAFELTCMMLEDAIPGLEIKILDPQEN
ncbi:hypothetical protein QAD02_018818 [Eretmocerus hayati]|uniref:Uncharacterized protein n=1 Tax=Eretmocerus hayati TaxID=131215 RepID=A0ACC2PJ22_9HYME|nr:hypothetical protein QAD02_018818 [Eretmocerus hayati]